MLMSKRGWMTCLLTASLLLSTLCWQSIAQEDVKRVSGGYLLSEQAMRDTVTGWQSDHAAVMVLRQGIDDLQREIQLQAEDTQQQLAELKRELTAERKRYAAAVRRSKGQGILIGVIIGVVAGAIAH